MLFSVIICWIWSFATAINKLLFDKNCHICNSYPKGAIFYQSHKVFYTTFLTFFMMVYLTDSVGLAAGVVGTLIAVSKLIDGFTDIFFGSMIDKTHSKMGKAKPWMLYVYIGCAITLVCCFAVPVSWGTTAKYAWF